MTSLVSQELRIESGIGKPRRAQPFDLVPSRVDMPSVAGGLGCPAGWGGAGSSPPSRKSRRVAAHPRAHRHARCRPARAAGHASMTAHKSHIVCRPFAHLPLRLLLSP